jgi:SH3 domain protein
MKHPNAARCLAAATVCILTMFSRVVAAQEGAPPPLFVSDRLVLNVYAEPDQAGERVASIETGDAVTELERVENLIRVRLEDGREGWVGANYLTTEAPAAVRLRELQRAGKSAVQAAEQKSADEIARLKQDAAKLQFELTALKANAASPTAASPMPASSEEESVEADVAQSAPASASQDRAIWMWPVVVLLAGGLGFTAGYKTLAGRIRRKFGGLKIY